MPGALKAYSLTEESPSPSYPLHALEAESESVSTPPFGMDSDGSALGNPAVHSWIVDSADASQAVFLNLAPSAPSIQKGIKSG